jgi:hypothetical protein
VDFIGQQGMYAGMGLDGDTGGFGREVAPGS